MLTSTGAKYIGRSICLWGGEAKLLQNFERARMQLPQVRAADPEMILEACIFEIVTTEVEQVTVPDWAFTALGLPVVKRTFRYEAMLYPAAQRTRSWGRGAGVPDVSQTETQLWFYFLAASYIDLGFEGIHWGQMEIMNGNDPHLDHYARIFPLRFAPMRRNMRIAVWCCVTPTFPVAAWCATVNCCSTFMRSCRSGSRSVPDHPRGGYFAGRLS